MASFASAECEDPALSAGKSLPCSSERPSSQDRSSQDDITSSETGHLQQAAADSTAHGLKACTTCGATETPMWRNGACGPKTLCNACGVKYQRRMHKQKVAADLAAAEAAAAAAGASEQLDSSARLHRSGSGALRPRHDGPPVLTRRSCNKEPRAGIGSSSQHPQLSSDNAAMPQQQSVALGDAKVRKARRLTDGSSRCSHSPQQASTQTARTQLSSGAAAAAPVAFRAGTPTRLDGLQMQMMGRGDTPITIPHVTVLLQPVTRAQALWTNAASPAPSVALCAYDSSGSFLAAAPNVPDPAIAWSYPTSQTATWSSGHGWSLLFVAQQQHDAFRGLLLEWQVAAKARQAQTSEGPSSEESGESAETDTSRHTFHHGGAEHLQRQDKQQRSASRKRTVNCVRAVSDAIPISSAAMMMPTASAASAPAGDRALLAASPKRPCSMRSRPGGTSSLSPSTAHSLGYGGDDGIGLGRVAEDHECFSPVELEMAATIGSPESAVPLQAATFDASGTGRHLVAHEASVRGGSQGLHTAHGARVHGFSAPPLAPLAASSAGGPSLMYAPGSQHGSGNGMTFMMSMGSGEWAGAASQPYGSLGGDSEASAATGYTQLSRRFGSMHVASSDSLSDLAFSRGACPTYPSDRSYHDGSSHGRRRRGRSSPSSVDTEGRVRSGQLQHGTTFASMAAVAPMSQPGMMRIMAPAPTHDEHGGSGGGGIRRSCSSLLDELHTEMDPLDPRFLAQVTAPSEAAVRGGSAAHALLHSEEPLIAASAPPTSCPGTFAPEVLCSAGFAAGPSNGFHVEGTGFLPDMKPHTADEAAAMDSDWLRAEPPAPPPLSADTDLFQQAPPPLSAPMSGGWSQPMPTCAPTSQAAYQPTALQQHLGQQQRQTRTPPPQAPQLQQEAGGALPPSHSASAVSHQQIFADDPAIADILSECSGWLLDAEEGGAATERSMPALLPMAPHVLPGSAASAEWDRTTARLAATIQEDTRAPWMPPRHHKKPIEDTAGPWAPKQASVPAR